MPGWLYNVVQNFGRDIIQLTPEVIKTARGEVAAHRDQYLDKRLYWTARGGLAELDARDHREWVEGDLSTEEKLLLERMQAAGQIGAWNDIKPQHRRPWTGAWWFRYQLRTGQLDYPGNKPVGDHE